MADIAIIGSSLIMSFYANILSKKNKVTIYEANDFGGTWAANEYKQGIKPLFNNLICPLSEEEDDIIEEIEIFINKAGGNVEVRNERLNVLTDYKPKKYIVGDFFSAITNNFNDVFKIKKEKVSSVEIMNDGISLNGIFYNKILFPENFTVDQIIYKGEIFPMEGISIVSKHVRAFVSSILDLPYYNEDTDNIFDRGGKFNDNVFIGRVRKECKDFIDARYISESTVLSGKMITDYQINRYHNIRLSPDSLALLKRLQTSHIFYPETAQFCRSYIRLRENLLSNSLLFNKFLT